MRKGALLVFAIFARLSPDSARTKNTIAKMAASQKIARTALDLFILLVLLLRASLADFDCVEPQLTLYGSATGICAGGCKKRKSNL